MARPDALSSVPDVAASPELPALPPPLWIHLLDRDRIKQKLRISLTDHCNWGCFFCHNEGQGPVGRTRSSGLTVSEIVAVARVALSEGVTKIKLTGGEPLLYRSGSDDVVALVRGLAALRSGSQRLDLSMTTNASLMPEYARRLRESGLDRVTVSITTLDSTQGPGKFVIRLVDPLLP